MAKKKTIYECQNCGSQYPKWQGQCMDCGQWNTLVESVPVTLAAQSSSNSSAGWVKTQSAQVTLLNLKTDALELEAQNELRIQTGIHEFDRVVGGGLVRGSYLLLGGDPGIGKSTILIQACGALSLAEAKTLYISGEESPKQTLLRAHRLGIRSEHVQVASENRIEMIKELVIQNKPDLLVVDSIQTVFAEHITSAPGTVSQVRECANQLLEIAKSLGVIVILVGHVTKDGNIAGPKVLEHMVDTVLSFEGDSQQQFRILRALKNRFGPTNEIGVFQMNNEGLDEVKNPSELFLEDRTESLIGAAVHAAMEGTRPLLCEIQSLTSTSYYPNPRRHCVGLELNRVHLILAVLNRYLNMDFAAKDVFINVVGGLKINEPASDLAIAASLISSQNNLTLPLKSCFIGEVGLTGEIRGISQIYDRVSEALKLGFKTFYLPESNQKAFAKNKLLEQSEKIHWLKDISGLYRALGGTYKSNTKPRPSKSTNQFDL